MTPEERIKVEYPEYADVVLSKYHGAHSFYYLLFKRYSPNSAYALIFHHAQEMKFYYDGEIEHEGMTIILDTTITNFY